MGSHGRVIPSHWVPHRRPDDQELVGYTVRHAAGTVPLSLLGHPLATPQEPGAAIALLEARGLACLAESWWLRTRDDEVEVRILEVFPDRVRVVEAPYGFYGPDSPRHILRTPATELSPRPRR
jgi:hypothetical protein